MPGAIVGAGTVVSIDQFEEVRAAGARFIVWPRPGRSWASISSRAAFPSSRRVATAGDIMRGLDMGLDHFKFFPAETSGGVKALKALAVLPVQILPTGGITEKSAPRLARARPRAVHQRRLGDRGHLAEIEARARAAAAIPR
ncbi:bifunctional 4-hydroxy-2-oxoglutarate aldolase/2-dehydro-3-deoxy-phosphogluconate aldolase [Sphingomonas sp. MMS24-JH45]